MKAKIAQKPRICKQAKTDDIHIRRRQRVWQDLPKEADAFLITNVHNVRYLSGFTGEDSFLLLRKESGVLITDSRFTTQAAEEVKELKVHTRKNGISKEIAAIISQLDSIKRLAVEADGLTVSMYDRIAKSLDGCELLKTSGVVEKVREIKDKNEHDAIMQALAISERAYANIKPLIRAGVTERYLAAQLDVAMRRHGADTSAFETIVASGPRAALPHASPTDRQIQAGECVLIDWGAKRNLYHSDLTRVLFVHKMPLKWRGIYTAVIRAQAAAIRKIKAGVATGAVYGVARRSLDCKGFGRYFTHGLGHGVGLEIHEGPSVSHGQKGMLHPGMVITVEPGVYLPGIGGIRIEDMVIVTHMGCKTLSSVPKELDAAIV